MAALGDLVLLTGTPMVLTATRDVDARTALCMALAAYLGKVTRTTADGRVLKFAKVFSTHADVEEPAEYPAAYVGLTGPGAYDASQLTPRVAGARDLLPDGRYLLNICELVAPMVVDAWTRDPAQRAAVALMLEDALCAPLDWRYGPLVEVPTYHGQRAAYAADGQEYVEADPDVQARYRRVRVTLTGRIVVCRAVTKPVALAPRARVTVDGLDT